MAYFEGFWSGDVFILSLRQGLACITLVLVYEVRNYLFDALVADPETREQIVNLLALCLHTKFFTDSCKLWCCGNPLSARAMPSRLMR